MINRYRRTARLASELALGELKPLDLAIPDLAAYPRIAHEGVGQEAESDHESRMISAGGPFETRTRTLFPTRDFKTDRTRTDHADPRNMPSGSDEIALIETARGQSVGNPDTPEPTSDADGTGAAHVVPVADAVETALATALERASLAGRWATVEALARELEARRRARVGVVDLGALVAKRRG